MWSWDLWKKGFDAWENTTAGLLEAWMRSPLLLEPSGAMLSATMRLKAASDQAAAAFWGALGLPTKRDQERTLHAVHLLESRLLDLEERLEGAAAGTVTPAGAGTTTAGAATAGAGTTTAAGAAATAGAGTAARRTRR